jgi:hypothetical protein
MGCGGGEMKKSKRVVLRVRWDRNRYAWFYEFDDGWEMMRSYKKTILAVARKHAYGILASGGLAQIVVYGKDGKIQTEYTYGKDPRKSR